MRAIHCPARGFTLAELMLSLALLVFLMMASALAIQAAHASHVYNMEKTDLVTKSRGVLDRLARDVRRCSSFNVPDACTVTISMPNGDTNIYAWDGVAGGNLTYTYIPEGSPPGSSGTSGILTNQVQTFLVTDDSPACTVKIVLQGSLTTSAARISATPRKAVY
jgi:prepilin-type N-terminal cleavage/methylation domain-containing protein